MSTLEIKDLHVEIEGKEILKGVNLTLKLVRSQPSWDQTEQGNLLCQLPLWETQIMEVTKGEILFDGVNILELEVDERARMGLFPCHTIPSEIPGITNAEFYVQP